MSKTTHRIRIGVSALLSVAIATMILFFLFPVFDPEAKLIKFNLRKINVNISTIYLEIELTNPNRLRGFNYTNGGMIDIYYYRTNDSFHKLLSEFHPVEYQGFGKPLRWNFTANTSTGDVDWDVHVPLLKTKEAHLYALLYLTYWYKILVWNTKTPYYQWLDTHAYLNSNLDLDHISNFNRTMDFDIALS